MGQVSLGVNPISQGLAVGLGASQFSSLNPSSLIYKIKRVIVTVKD